MRTGWRSWFPATQDLLHVLLTLVLTPGIFLYEILFVLPAVEASYVHTLVGFFLLHNVAGNAFCGRMAASKSSVYGKMLPTPQKDWRLCAECESYCPPRSWHCNVCRECVLKRDHHCNFFGCCIGYYNHRYFYMFVLHVFVSTAYAFCFNLYFMIYFFKWNLMSWMALWKFVFPLAVVAIEFTEESFHVLFFIVTFVSMAFTAFLLIYHGKVIVRGLITPESKKLECKDLYNRGLLKNIIEVFGERWYLTWISPLMISKLPSDGIHWSLNSVAKVE